MKSPFFFLLFFISFLSNTLVSGQQYPTQLDRHFEKKMKKAGIIGMQLGYIHPDGSTWYNSYGIMDYSTGQSVNNSTLFMIASCSKPVTALAILKLFNDGQLNIDYDINRYLSFKIHHPFYPSDSITTRMLLAHTAAFKDNWDILDPLYTLKEGGDSPIMLSDFVKDYFTPSGKYYHMETNFLKERPGQHWEYSNMGYALLGLLIEELTGKGFSQYMQEAIFTPLHMYDSYWFLKNIPHENIARPHQLAGKKDSTTAPLLLKHYGFPDFPDGQLRTTVRDYMKFVNLVLNEGKLDGKQFIKKEIIELFHTVQYPAIHKYQAVAWNFDEFENWLYYLFMKRLPSHTGGDPGVATVVSYNPKNKTAAVVFLNSPPVTFKGGKIFYLDLPKRLLKEAKMKKQAKTPAMR